MARMTRMARMARTVVRMARWLADLADPVFCIGSYEPVHEDRTVFCLYCLALSFEFE